MPATIGPPPLREAHEWVIASHTAGVYRPVPRTAPFEIWAAATARTETIAHDRRPRTGLLSRRASASPSQRPARHDSHAYIHPAEARPSRHRRCLRTVPAITRKKDNNVSSQPPSELTRPHLFTLPPASPPSLPRWTTRTDCPASLPLPAARRRPSSVSAGSCLAAPPSQPQRASSPTVAPPSPPCSSSILRRGMGAADRPPKNLTVRIRSTKEALRAQVRHTGDRRQSTPVKPHLKPISASSGSEPAAPEKAHLCFSSTKIIYISMTYRTHLIRWSKFSTPVRSHLSQAAKH